MSRVLLTANWTNLLIANFETDKRFLEPYVPAGTELNDWNGKYFMSLVGFEFSNPKLFGVPSPFFRSFPELNLRFYVKRKLKNSWRKGVVFIKEIASSKLVGAIAGWLYKENFTAFPLKRNIKLIGDKLNIEYYLIVNNKTNYFTAIASSLPSDYDENTLEGFIRDHYWGYTRVTENSTKEFLVTHRPWNIHAVSSVEIKIDAATLYGDEFDPYFKSSPYNIFLMDGSETKVTGPVHI